MTDANNIRLSYFIDTASQHLGDDLIGVALTDSFLRQPDYSSRGAAQLYLIVRAERNNPISLLRYLQAEFPELILNYITLAELQTYPPHCVWQFSLAPWIHGKRFMTEVLSGIRRDDIEGIRQALFSVAHLARLYYLRKLPVKTHVWGVRQLGWALRCAEIGIYKWLCQLENWEDEPRTTSIEMDSNIAWLLSCNRDWHKVEGEFLTDPSAFRQTVARLNKIVEHYVDRLDALHPQKKYQLSAAESSVPAELESVLNPVITALTSALGARLQALYLHGSAARGDMRPGSDIDCIAIVDRVDLIMLEAIRVIQERTTDLTISVFSLADVNQYPQFRQYALSNGTIRIFGNVAINMTSCRENDEVAIWNNIHTIRQVARAYLISGQYGPRAHYVLSLMMKLADHGCLRLLKKIETRVYAEKKALLRIYFSDQPLITMVLDYAMNLSNREEKMRHALLRGERSQIENAFTQLLSLADVLTAHLKK